jgi:hypothetical protein
MRFSPYEVTGCIRRFAPAFLWFAANFEAGELAGEAGNTLTFQLYRRPVRAVPTAMMQLLPSMCSIQMTIL